MSAFTPQQQQAIAARGNVLVVAGAGTGKTSTLVARCLRLVQEEEGSLNEMLLVTFTEAAAAEMRQRIRAALLKELRARPDHPRLAEQLALLDTAHISTLHSFCLRLVREHFDELGIDPEVSVLDEAQTQPLIQSALDAVLQRHYGKGTDEARAVEQLVRTYGRGSDSPIRALMLRLHTYTQSLADPDGWFERELARLEEAEPAQWRRWLVAGVEEWMQLWLPVLGEQVKENPVARLCEQSLSNTVAELRACLDRPAGDGTSLTEASATIAAALAQIQEVDATGWPPRKKTELRKPLKKLFEEAAFLGGLTDPSRGTDPLAEDWSWVRHPMTALLKLAREFTGEFSRAKRDLGGVDFADLEQFALRLLRQPGSGELTPLAQHWRQQFRHVFVDEYQDINAAQDAILTALGRDGAEANRFLVGDVKQSIYRFRRANPGIFREYERRWRSGDGGGVCIPLADNFRSREALLAGVNSLFAALMRPAIGGVAYDAEAQLRFGHPEGRQPLALAARAAGLLEEEVQPRVELHLLTRAKTESDDDSGDSEDAAAGATELLDLMAAEKEARLVAYRLRELKEQSHRVWDAPAGGFRPVRWGDMAVLLRAPASKVEAYAQEFHRAGVPLVAPRGGFFAALEVMDLLNLLKLLDNPLQDVPLLGVLRSPLVGLSLEELAEIRAHNRERLFWTALNRFHRESAHPLAPSAGSEPMAREANTVHPPPFSAAGRIALRNSAWSKVDLFLRQFASWRERIRQTSLSYCLEAVILETHYDALLQAGDRGAERSANVRRLLDLCRQYDPYQRQGLYRFLRFVEAQQEAELELEPAPVPAEDAVQLLSVHKSKGLEFPVVVLADLGKRFNLEGLRADILLDEHFGLCPSVVPPDSQRRYPSLPLWLARQRERRELLGEELRLLYVATTRARDTLILVGTVASKTDDGGWAGMPAKPLTDHEILAAQSSLDWLRLWLPQVTARADWLADHAGRNSLLQWRIYTEDDQELAQRLAALPATTAAVPSLTAFDDAAVERIQAQVDWPYPFAAAALEPAKRSVTGLVRSRVEADDEAQPWEFFKGTKPKADAVPARDPSAAELTAAETGIAHHTFLQWVALDRLGSRAELQAESARMQRDGRLSAAQVAVLDFDALEGFWQSEVGRAITAQPDQIKREVPFTARFTLTELGALGWQREPSPPPDEFIVVQGVVDLAVLRPDEIWIVDFKTDDLRPRDLSQKVEYYRPQLQLYGLALEKIFGRPARKRWLHFLTLGRSVAV